MDIVQCRTIGHADIPTVVTMFLHHHTRIDPFGVEFGVEAVGQLRVVP